MISQKPQKKWFKIWRLILIAVCGFGLIWGWGNWRLLQVASTQPVDGILVLGGSIQREIYGAKIVQQFPQIPVLISRGSHGPCIVELFQRTPAPLGQVWLEECAKSTFENFYFSLPILQDWQVHHLKLITSSTHLPRAMWLGQIMLGSHGIWVEVDTLEEKGVPGNREYGLKTILDVIRGCLWAVVSHLISPHCPHVLKLTDINLVEWCNRGFTCEYQGSIDVKKMCSSRSQNSKF